MKAKLIIICIGILVMLLGYWGVKRLRGGGDSELESEEIVTKKTESSAKAKSGDELLMVKGFSFVSE
jgi:hypothetical protein